MSRRELVAMARLKSIVVRNHSKANIIRAIQRADGNDDCFGTDKVDQCNQKDCLWYEHCVAAYLNILIKPKTYCKTKEDVCNKYNLLPFI